jgi:predicted signal transduction protein with EAL and GGDEF domain
VAVLPDVAASAEELIKAADTAMYRVKDFGKNGVRLAVEQLENKITGELTRSSSVPRFNSSVVLKF